MEKYGDPITNGLDLLSFLLVTPEILRVITPAAAFLIKIVAFMLALFAATASVAGMLIASYPWIYPWMIEWKLPYWFICVDYRERTYTNRSKRGWGRLDIQARL